MTKHIEALWKDESAEGAIEYILILTLAVSLCVLVKDFLLWPLKNEIAELQNNLNEITVEGGRKVASHTATIRTN